MKKNTLIILAAALTLALSLTACGGEVITKTPDSLNQQGQTAASDSEAPASERTATGTMLLDEKETTVYPEVSDTEINFWDSASGGKLLPKRSPELPKRSRAAIIRILTKMATAT